MKKVFLLILFILAGLFLAYLKFAEGSPPKTKVEVPTAASTIVPSIAAAIEDPVSIYIPSLEVTSAIENVGLDEEGRMDTPKDFNNTGWYSPGVKPGQIGSAVIDGHVDTPDGKPSVFAKLSTLQSGDLVIITGDKGTKYTFKVTRGIEYNLTTIPMDEIFKRDVSDARLNLITCSGTWNKEKKIYTSRYVVYATLVD